MFMFRRQDSNGPHLDRFFELHPDATFIECDQYGVDIYFRGNPVPMSHREFEEGSETKTLLVAAWSNLYG